MLVKVSKDAHKEDGFYYYSMESLGANDNGTIKWYECREQFQQYCPRIDKIFYLLEESLFDNVARFVSKVESILKLPTEQKAKLYKTTNKKVILCRLGKFWRIRCRRELFTILLRDGVDYTKRHKNFWKFVKQCYYLGRIVEAFKYFLKGNTVCKGNKHFEGWLKEFNSGEIESPYGGFLLPNKKELQEIIKRRLIHAD